MLEHLPAARHEVRVVVSARAHRFPVSRSQGRPNVRFEEIPGRVLGKRETFRLKLEALPAGLLKNIGVHRRVAEDGVSPEVITSDCETWADLEGSCPSLGTLWSSASSPSCPQAQDDAGAAHPAAGGPRGEARARRASAHLIYPTTARAVVARAGSSSTDGMRKRSTSTRAPTVWPSRAIPRAASADKCPGATKCSSAVQRREREGCAVLKGVVGLRSSGSPALVLRPRRILRARPRPVSRFSGARRRTPACLRVCPGDPGRPAPPGSRSDALHLRP